MHVTACHQANYEALKVLKGFSHAQEMILRAIHLQTSAKDKPSAQMPRSSIATLCGLSDRTVKRHLDLLVRDGYVDRVYSCHSCGGNLAVNYFDIAIGKCPMCGEFLFKKIWARLRLTTRGAEVSSLISVIDINTVEKPILTSCLTWAARVGRLLGVDNPSQVEALARFRQYEKALVRVESDWELALALACEENRCHKGNAKTVLSLVGVIRWALRRIIETAPKTEGRFECPLEPEVRTRMDYIIDHMQTIAASSLPEDNKQVERLIMVLYLQDTIQENAIYAAGIDKMVREAGFEPRTLLPKGTTAEAMVAQSFSPPARLLWYAN